MASLTYAQLEGIWLQAAQGTQYATQTWAALMAAIAEAESGGNPQATNPADNNGTQTSWGLWQISDGTHSQPSPNWNNPLVNAQLAVAKLQSQGLGAWGTYTSGAYKAYQSNSTSPDTSGLSQADLTAATSAAAAGSTAATAKGEANCAWSIGWGGIPGTSWLNWLDPFSSGSGNVGSGEVCLISKPQLRALTGVGVMLGGLVITVWGVSVLAAASAVPAALRLAGALPGRGAAAKAGAAAGAPAADVALAA